MNQTGILLLNLGTPDQCDRAHVSRYLTEFLNDPRVIDLPTYLRWPLVNLLIVPFRAGKAAEAYQKIWQSTGSPLLTNSQALQQALAKKLGANFQVALGMRYGKPTIASAMQQLQHCSKLIVVPLFPQYSSAATGSALQKVLEIAAKQWNIPEIVLIRDFYNDAGFISSYAAIIADTIAPAKPDMILFSYHGLPERHITKSECHAVCDHIDACPVMSDQNAFCYRAQCFATTQLLAEKLALTQNQYRVSFQSRLGKTPWIKPYTDLVLPELAANGVKKLAIVCPSFVADCLETLEEINLRAREQWLQLGGESLTFVPCLNAHPLWVDALANLINR